MGHKVSQNSSLPRKNIADRGICRGGQRQLTQLWALWRDVDGLGMDLGRTRVWRRCEPNRGYSLNLWCFASLVTCYGGLHPVPGFSGESVAPRYPLPRRCRCLQPTEGQPTSSLFILSLFSGCWEEGRISRGDVSRMEHLQPEEDACMKQLNHTLGPSSPSVLLMRYSPREVAFGWLLALQKTVLSKTGANPLPTQGETTSAACW